MYSVQVGSKLKFRRGARRVVVQVAGGADDDGVVGDGVMVLYKYVS